MPIDQSSGDRTTEWNSWANPAYDASGNIDWEQAPDYVQQMPGTAFAYDGSGNKVYYQEPEVEAPTEAAAPIAGTNSTANGGNTGTPGLPTSDMGGSGGTGGTGPGLPVQNRINGTAITPAFSADAYTSTTSTYRMPSEQLRQRLDRQKQRNAARRTQTNRGLGAAMGAATGGQSSNTIDVLDEFLSTDNRVMQRAETDALQTANERGLLNSSMAVGAATGAVVDSAQPYVLQESGQRADKERAAQDWTYQSSLAEQDYEQGSQQQAQGYEESYSLQNLENASRIDLAMVDRDTRVRLQEMADAQAMAISELNVSSENINFAVNAANSAQDRYNDTVRQIMESEQMSAEEKAAAIEQAGNGMLATYTYLENLYNIDFDWQSGNYTDAVV